MMIPHQDGVGSYGAWSIIWEWQACGKYLPMDFDRAYQEHKNLEFLRALLGHITNGMLLSILFEGMGYCARGFHLYDLYKNTILTPLYYRVISAKSGFQSPAPSRIHYVVSKNPIYLSEFISPPSCPRDRGVDARQRGGL